MTLGETLHKSLSDWPAGTDGPHEVTASANGWTAKATAEAIESVGAKLRSVEVTRTDSAPDGASVGAWAEGIAQRSSGLMERLKVLEVDASENVAVLRSETPTVKQGVAGYYEVCLEGTDKATVNRYAVDKKSGGKREAVPFALTHESLAKLVEDVVG